MGMVRKQWRLGNGDVDEYRRTLLIRARKGDAKAETELMEKYGMRVYSSTERSKMPVYYDSGKKGSPPSPSAKSMPGSSVPSKVKKKTTTGKAKKRTK